MGASGAIAPQVDASPGALCGAVFAVHGQWLIDLPLGNSRAAMLAYP